MRDVVVVAGMALPCLLAGIPAQAVPSIPASTAATSARTALLDVVLLVDESGSETAAKIADEEAVASIVVQSQLNPSSRVTVVGFGGVNHVTPGQSPVDVVCKPTIASSAANLSYLSSCVTLLHRRTEAEGDDTDYAAALGQAMSYLSPASTATPPSPPGAEKVILMMTDGVADVHRDTQQYGTNWQLGEQTAINQQMAAAKADGVQLWPLGFGTDIGASEQQALSYLSAMAARGAPGVCGGNLTQPHATWVNNPDDAIGALNTLYAASSCAGLGAATSVLGAGQQTTLELTIPGIASDAAISVDRGNPGIQVRFTQPDGTPWTDASAISGSGAVVVLHLSDVTSAEVGVWKITLTAPPGLADQLVSASTFWQGAVRAIITAVPSSARPGQTVNVTLSVLGPQGPITDPTTLKGLVVGATAVGQGLPGTVKVRLTSAAGDGPGIYSGSFSAPEKASTVTVTGSAAGYGLYVTKVPQTVTVGTIVGTLTAAPQFPVVSSVQVGQTISGQVVLANQTGASQRVALVLAASGATATLTSPSGSFTVPSGNPPSVPFTVTIARSSRTGAAWLNVQTINPSTGQVYGSATLSLTVTKPPGLIAKFFWEIFGAVDLLLLGLVGLVWRRTVTRRRRNVSGLVVILRRNGEQLGAELRTPSRWSESFGFIIRDEDESAARLDYPEPGIAAYHIRRAKAVGTVVLTSPHGGAPLQMVVGGRSERIGHGGLELAVRDVRRRPLSERRPANSSGPPPSEEEEVPGGASLFPYSPPAAPYIPPAASNIPPATKDEWL